MNDAIDMKAIEAVFAEDSTVIENKQQKPTKVSSVERTLNEFEQEQKLKGWNPDGPKSAEEWARAEPLYEELKSRGKEIKQLKRTVDQLVEHMKKQESYAYEKAMKELNTQRQTAVYNGDTELVEQIDKEKANLPTLPQDKPEAVIEFEERHAEWLSDTSYEAMEMQDWVYKRDGELLKLNLSPEEHMRVLDEHVRKRFPKYFNKDEIEEEASSLTVETGHSNNVASRRIKKNITFNDLTPEQKQIGKDFERMGVMKMDDYIKDLIKLGDIK